MTAIHKTDESEQYLAPKCKVFFVNTESTLLTGSDPDGMADPYDEDDDNNLDPLN